MRPQVEVFCSRISWQEDVNSYNKMQRVLQEIMDLSRGKYLAIAKEELKYSVEPNRMGCKSCNVHLV